MAFTYRSDDFVFGGSLDYLKSIQECFIKAKVNHTLSIVGIPKKNNAIVDYVKNTPYFDVQIHSWDHATYDTMNHKNLYQDYKTMVDWIEETFGKRPTKIYPAWGPPGTGPLLEETAKKLGLTIDVNSAFIIYYLGSIWKGEKCFKTAGETSFGTGENSSDEFVPYSEWRSVYFHLNKKDQASLIPVLIEATQEMAREEADHFDFKKKAETIKKINKAMEFLEEEKREREKERERKKQ